MKKTSIYMTLLFLGSSFFFFSEAMEEDKYKGISISKILSKLHLKKPHKKKFKEESLGKKKRSKKRIHTARIDAYLAKGRRNGIRDW